MNRLHPHVQLAQSQQRRINRQVGAIEWEELPSLADSLSLRLIRPGTRHADFENSSAFQTAWNPTMPAALDPLVESGPFTEPLHGLVTRELREPDVFRHFFA